MGDLTVHPERRAFPRVRVRIESLVSTPNGPIRGQTMDLSAGGAFVTTARAVAVGTPVRLTMHRGAAKNPLVLDAEVVRVGGTREGRFAGLGLRFVGLSQLEATLLQAMLGSAA
ncbi:PilZ domain-containing protein [Nannocystis pusilla]|uniref:PilZ domain-containing protein n=1 Tax=Nannocystis pusilla TaxID=889268 RepID=A0ABS7TYQ4_9BACT|nr:PilZ domain-containing protein [Nannocystis pusilla]MBZ5713329.1 PilZ domain-containing protein [Nannocystis pusilla]